MDKGYHGLLEEVCAVHPKKCPPRDQLSGPEFKTNKNISFCAREELFWSLMYSFQRTVYKV